MKIHVGEDDTLGLIHSLKTTTANVHNLTPSHELLHGEEHRAFGDTGYVGIQNREEHRKRSVDWFTNCRYSQRRQYLKSIPLYQLEQVFSRIKNQFGYNKVRYRGLHKNTNRLYLLAGFTNLLRVKNVGSVRLLAGKCPATGVIRMIFGLKDRKSRAPN